MYAYRERRRLTGRISCKPSIFDKLVLTVEEAIERAAVNDLVSVPFPGGCYDIESWREREKQRKAEAWKEVCRDWRDARWQDLLALDQVRDLANVSISDASEDRA